MVIPDGVSAIETWAFYHCKGIETVSMPNSVTRIGQCAFKWCSHMKKINFSESLVHIEPFAFEECRNLTSIIIPQSIEGIGFGAFRNCIRLADISVPADFVGFSSQVFENTRWEKNYPDDFMIINNLLYRYKGNEKNINIPDSVKIIGQFALAFSDIETVTVSDCVDEIRDSAFCGCKKLVSVTLPDSVKKIESSTFYNCECLEKINLPDSIEEIGFEAFKNCRKLSDTKLPPNLKVLGARAFKDDAWLKNGDSEFLIIDSALCAYRGNKKVVDIPEGVTEMGHIVFANCEELTSIKLSTNIVQMGEDIFYGHAPELCVFVEKECFAAGYARRHKVKCEILEAI